MPKKILIIDDDDGMRRAIRRLLTMAGTYVIEEVADALEAEKTIAEFQPDLIILDIKMPGRDGYEICMNIRDQMNLKDVKIVAISGVSGGIGNAIMSSLGADYFFAKPFNNDEFKLRIAKLLEGREHG